MIGPRSAVPAAIALVAVTLGLGPGAPRPEIELAADRLVDERATDADAAIARLQAGLAAATDLGREGAAAIVAGDESPGTLLAAAAERLVLAIEPADRAGRTVAGLDGALLARDPSTAAALPPAVSGAELASIAAQLEGARGAADTFAEMRRRAANVPVALDASLRALTDGRLDAAGAHLAAAAADQDAVAAWDVDYVALPVWVEATDATIAAVERLVAAIGAGDQEAANEAASDFVALADAATRADRALQITISEEGAGIAAAPLSRMADAQRATDALRAAIGEVRILGAMSSARR